jgi:cobalamin biosynthesis Mg chelatase CobN
VRIPRTVVSLAAAALLVPTAGAAAADVTAPGNSAVDQYRESAPPGSSSSKKVPGKTRRKLESAGEDGKALAAALDRTGGVPRATASGTGAGTEADGPKVSGDSGASGDDRDGADPSSGTAPSGAALDGSAGSPVDAASAPKSAAETAAAATLGPFPIWVTVLAAFAVIGVALVVRRRASA